MDSCLQCGQTREQVKANGTYCATVDHYGECQDGWPRHRWRDWSDAELARLRILPEFMELYRRTDVDDFQFIDCEHQGREHKPWDEPDGPPEWVCVGCWKDLRKVGGQDA